MFRFKKRVSFTVPGRMEIAHKLSFVIILQHNKQITPLEFGNFYIIIVVVPRRLSFRAFYGNAI